MTHIIDAGWTLQHKLERRFKKYKPLSFKEYLFRLSLFFILMGIVLFFYYLMLNYDLNIMPWFIDPLFYLGVGITVFILFYMEKRYKFFNSNIGGEKRYE